MTARCNRLGGTSCAALGPLACSVVSGRIVTVYSSSSGWVRRPGIANDAPAATLATARNPGPPWNCDGRVTVIVPGSGVGSQVIGGAQNATSLPLSSTGASSARSPIHPKSGMLSCGSSRDTRSDRVLGGDTTAANGPGGGLPQHTPSSQTSPCERSQSLLEWHIGARPGGTSRQPASPRSATAAAPSTLGAQERNDRLSKEGIMGTEVGNERSRSGQS